MGKRKTGSKIVTSVNTQDYYFRDRKGHRYGPCRDEAEIKGVIQNNSVDICFKSQEVLRRTPEGIKGFVIVPVTDFIMENSDFLPVDPQIWFENFLNKKRKEHQRSFESRYKNFVFRQGHVSNIHRPRRYKMWKTPNFGRKVRDTGHGCLEDNEPKIRVKLSVKSGYAWDDFDSTRAKKSWKHYRQHQWREK